MSLRDLADLLASNDDNTTSGQVEPGKRDATGMRYQLVRVIAVDRAEIREALTQGDATRDQTTVDLARDGYPVRWHYADAAFPLLPSAEAACQVAAYLLQRDRPAMPVRGCVVWIGNRRWWLGYQGTWNGAPPQVQEEYSPRPSA
ncbi:MAG TPA: hypothetical protein VHX44_10510 [Planctomycetota bacterium]|nr:hypothetical protein [Planctomycetota bacterium]